MEKKIIIDQFGIGCAVAIKHNKNLYDLFLDPPANKIFYPKHAIIIAKVIRKISSLGGYFISLPNGQKGLLKTKKIHKLGTNLKVRSKTFFESNKPQQFLDTIKLEGEFSIISEGKGRIFFSRKINNLSFKNKTEKFIKMQDYFRSLNIDIIVRDKAHSRSFSSFVTGIKNEINEFCKLFEYQAKSIEVLFHGESAKEKAIKSIIDLDSYNVIEEKDSFEAYGIWDDIERILESRYEFGNGSYLYIEQTHAFCSIDVNSGNRLGIDPEKINLEACHEIMLNIRTRGIGGKIIIDFISCSKKVQLKIKNLMARLCEKETVPTKAWGWTTAKNFEVEREYHKTPLNLILNA